MAQLKAICCRCGRERFVAHLTPSKFANGVVYQCSAKTSCKVFIKRSRKNMPVELTSPLEPRYIPVYSQELPFRDH